MVIVYFFYGFQLISDYNTETLVKLLSQVKEYQPTERDRQAPDFSEVEWYKGIIYNPPNGSFEYPFPKGILGLFEAPLKLEFNWVWMGDQPDLKEGWLVLSDPFQRVQYEIISFDIDLDTTAAKKLLRDACDKYGITIRSDEPSYHLIQYYDYDDTRKSEAYFFYGMLFEDYPAIVKVLLTKHRDFLNLWRDHYLDLLEQLLPKVIPQKFREFQEEYERRLAEDEAAGFDWYYPELYRMAETFFESNEANHWMPDEETIIEVATYERIASLGSLWEKDDPVGLDADQYPITPYMYIKSTYHCIDYRHSSPQTFDLGDIEHSKWDKLIQERCNQLGIEFKQPMFHIIAT